VPSKAILEKKKEQVKKLREIFQNDGIYFFDYRGLSVKDFEELRHKVREKEGNCRVVKNSIAARLFEEDQVSVDKELLKGPNAIIYGSGKTVEIAKVLVDFSREKEAVEIKSGFLDREYIQKGKIVELSKLPGRDQLVSHFLLTLVMPARKFGMSLSAPVKNILILMHNLKDKKAKEESQNG